jgi:hypothetical protein
MSEVLPREQGREQTQGCAVFLRLQPIGPREAHRRIRCQRAGEGKVDL